MLNSLQETLLAIFLTFERHSSVHSDRLINLFFIYMLSSPLKESRVPYTIIQHNSYTLFQRFGFLSQINWKDFCNFTTSQNLNLKMLHIVHENTNIQTFHYNSKNLFFFWGLIFRYRQTTWSLNIKIHEYNMVNISEASLLSSCINFSSFLYSQ